MTSLGKFKAITPQEFVSLGMQHLAYIKPVTVNDRPMFSIHAADGTPMAVMEDRVVAEAAVRQHELEPMSVH